MSSQLRKILLPLPALVRWYLSKKRTYHYKSLSIEVLPGVFHPGFFFSTTMLLQFVEKQAIKSESILELGAGTGIISLLAHKMGGIVTATDISQKAIENIHLNAKTNTSSLTIIRSDLFESVPVKIFDWIFINPPYYAKEVVKEEDFAWHCGEHHEYFIKLFKRLRAFITTKTRTIMVLSEVCDLVSIFRIASDHGFELLTIAEMKVWLDGKNYLFQIKPIAQDLHEVSTHTADRSDLL